MFGEICIRMAVPIATTWRNGIDRIGLGEVIWVRMAIKASMKVGGSVSITFSCRRSPEKPLKNVKFWDTEANARVSFVDLIIARHCS
jgi:hypothetical protein